MKRIILMFLCSVSLLIASAATPSQAIINLAKGEVESAKYYLPASTGMGTTLTKVWYIADKYTIAYKFVYDMPISKPTNQALSETKKGMIHMLKANPNSKDMSFLTSGITYHYNYYNPDGTFLYAIKITPSDVKK